MRKLKPILGVLLILLSVAGLFFWEWKGREAIMTVEVLVAREDIREGARINGSMFIAKGVQKTNLLEKALTPGDLNLVQGKVAAQFIAKNGQIVLDYFRGDEFRLNRDESIFVIDPGWISMRSSALRRGDVVDIYGNNGLGLLGTFRIAYVKDSSEREVRDAGEETVGGGGSGRSGNVGSGGGSSGSAGNGILDRPDSTSVIDHIEIISTIREYEYLVDCVAGDGGTTPAALIIVQRGDRIDS